MLKYNIINSNLLLLANYKGRVSRVLRPARIVKFVSPAPLSRVTTVTPLGQETTSQTTFGGEHEHCRFSKRSSSCSVYDGLNTVFTEDNCIVSKEWKIITNEFLCGRGLL
jgi:hypothetical protein